MARGSRGRRADRAAAERLPWDRRKRKRRNRKRRARSRRRCRPMSIAEVCRAAAKEGVSYGVYVLRHGV